MLCFSHAMKAWLVEQHGGPEVLRLVEKPEPVPGPSEALITVQTVSLNHLDLWVRRGIEGHPFPLPLIPGADIVGTIEKLGPLSVADTVRVEKSGLRVGTPVIVHPSVSCGLCNACLNGESALCRQFGILGESCDGGLAEKVVVPVQNLFRKPETLSPVVAACLPISGLTAYEMVVRKAQTSPGDFVLVHSAGSGVSIFAIQMAKLCGATVVTTTGTEEKAKHAALVGAAHVVNYKKTRFVSEFKRWLKEKDRKGFDVVVDHTGSDTLSDSIQLLRAGGKLLSCGATSGSDIQIDWKPIFFKSLSLIGSTMGRRGDLARVIDLAREGQIKPVIDSVINFKDLPKAHEKLEKREVFGKIVIQFR